jgi:hypothetical protein
MAPMDATEAFVAFVKRILIPAKASRFTELTSSKKCQRKILDALSHEFERAVREAASRKRDYSKLWEMPCFAFHPRVGFGAEFSNVRVAYDELTLDDGWLILLRDGSAGIFRPEAAWDNEKLIAG